MLGTMCEMEGADVTTAIDGKMALEHLAAKDFDILVSDVGMPTMDGYELLARLRKSARNADISAIALSGYGHSLRAAAVGFTSQLHKPVPMHELLDLLKAVMESKRRLRVLGIGFYSRN
ncbi:response regulator [Candidimonas sp. SYP-B2681]|nr:response regulator [Candidimonas sp. SYP-B2681]